MEKERRTLIETFERLWSDELHKVVQRVGETAGWSQDEARRYVRELSDKLVTQRRELERTVDDRVRATLARVRVPRREELQECQRRLDGLAARIAALDAPGVPRED